VVIVLTPPRPDIHLPAPPPIDDITRRDLLRGVGALSAGWALAGCADDGGDDAAGTDAGDSRLVEHPLGSTRIPRRPQRVVDAAFGSEVVETAAELGVELVGMRYVQYYTEAFPRPQQGSSRFHRASTTAIRARSRADPAPGPRPGRRRRDAGGGLPAADRGRPAGGRDRR